MKGQTANRKVYPSFFHCYKFKKLSPPKKNPIKADGLVKGI